MLLLDLPPELLGPIISLVGGPYNPDDYGNRLEDLRNCCLVSRAFRQIAQPELFAIIEVEDRKPLEAFRAAAKATGLGRTTATAVFRLPELRQLILYDLTLTTSSPSFALPRLVQLSACYTKADHSLSPACFSAETMPSLRFAAIVAPYFRGAHARLLSQLSPDLASKLEIMVVDFIDWPNVHSASPSCGPTTLIDCSFTRCQSPFDPTLPPISHLRLRPVRMASPVLAVATLADMLTASHPAVSPLRSIHLPIEFGSNEMSEPYPGLFAAYQDLSSVCAQKGVKIVFDAYPHIDVHSYIPRRISEWIGTTGSSD
ncbi:hypothetical protein JCM1840_005058 [Sporobolomyces johnsonii]